MNDNPTTPGSSQQQQVTGALASIARTQANHPKRTVFGGLAFFIVLSFLAFGPLKGTLENKFVIPGSDAQKATDVLKAKFGERNGAVLQVVFKASDGRLDSPARKAAIAAVLADASKTRVRDRCDRPVRRQQPALLQERPAHRLRRGAVLEGRVPAQPHQDRGSRGHDAEHARARPASRPSSRVTPTRRRPSRAPAS